ncbi:hypothetical protein E3N88_35972 [Mikania micrantha]|uniref:Uncharacterized protein n=1 Tax=Mikania micrantha TaxID=192012 RepID=A0A5N6M2T7_9ASTR|nr:hypothetical protein E3N88_35972 [Mikania micrantha]
MCHLWLACALAEKDRRRGRRSEEREMKTYGLRQLAKKTNYNNSYHWWGISDNNGKGVRSSHEDKGYRGSEGAMWRGHRTFTTVTIPRDLDLRRFLDLRLCRSLYSRVGR